MDVLVTYDIAVTTDGGAKRLRKMAQVCEKYGQRIQLSVFECRLSPTRLARLLGELQDVIDPRSDSVVVYRFAGSVADCRVRFGVRGPRELDRPWIL